ncbi:MAG: histone deacetylase, partial [Chthoniobacterales bacterium]
MVIFHDARSSEYSLAGHPERPARITQTVPFLRERHPEWEWRQPDPATDETLQRGHSIEHIE